MTGFFALLRLQLLSRFADLKPKNLKKAFAEKRGRTVGMTIAIIFLVLYLGGMLFFLEKTALDVLGKLGMENVLVAMAIMLAMIGTLIMSFFFIMSSLFLGRDAGYLAALPLKPRTILGSKLAQVWVSETLISAVLLLPACIQYGIRVGAGIGFYVRLIPVWLLVDVIPIAIVAFVSTLLIRLTALWKHREMLTTVFSILFVVAYMILMFNMGGMTGDSASGGEMMEQFFMNYSARITMLTKVFPPATWAAQGLLGDWGQLALYIAANLAAAALVIWLVGYVYRKLSLLQTEAPTGDSRKRTVKESFETGSAFKACVQRELRTILRVPSYATNILPIAFMPLLMVIMLYFVIGRSSGEGGTLQQLLAGAVSETLITGILFAAMAYVGGMNPALSTAVTREGKGHDMMKSLPVPVETIIRSKFVVGFGLSAIGTLSAGIALVVILPGMTVSVILASVMSLLFAYLNACLALIRDIRKPRLDWVTEQEAVKQNFGVMISMLISWGILIALGIASYFMITAGIDKFLYTAIICAVLLLICIVVRRRLSKTAEKYYYLV